MCVVDNMIHEYVLPTMSNNNARGRLSGVDSQSGIEGGVHLEVEGTVRRFTVDGSSIHILIRRQ